MLPHSSHTIKSIILAAALLGVVIGCAKHPSTVLGRPGTILGKVIQFGTSDGIPNVKVSTEPASTVYYTDAMGDYKLTDLVYNLYEVKAEKSGYRTITLDVQVHPDSITIQNFILVKDS